MVFGVWVLGFWLSQPMIGLGQLSAGGARVAGADCLPSSAARDPGQVCPGSCAAVYLCYCLVVYLFEGFDESNWIVNSSSSML